MPKRQEVAHFIGVRKGRRVDRVSEMEIWLDETFLRFLSFFVDYLSLKFSGLFVGYFSNTHYQSFFG